MDELDGDKIVRRTEFDSDTLEINRIYKDFNTDSNGAKSWAEDYLYSNGKLDFVKDYKSTADGTVSRAEGYSYSNGKLDRFFKDYKSTAYGTERWERWAEDYLYADGKLTNFIKDYTLTPDGTVSRAEGYSFSNGELYKFYKLNIPQTGLIAWRKNSHI